MFTFVFITAPPPAASEIPDRPCRSACCAHGNGHPLLSTCRRRPRQAPTPHAMLLLQGKPALDSVLLCICLDRTQHRGRTAGVDHIRLKSLLTDRIDDISLCSSTSVLCGRSQHQHTARTLRSRKVIHHGNLRLSVFSQSSVLCQLQHRRDTDSSADQECAFFCCNCGNPFPNGPKIINGIACLIAGKLLWFRLLRYGKRSAVFHSLCQSHRY